VASRGLPQALAAQKFVDIPPPFVLRERSVSRTQLLSASVPKGACDELEDATRISEEQEVFDFLGKLERINLNSAFV
jgi:hypothetical protein